jgi:hypothetical protein
LGFFVLCSLEPVGGFTFGFCFDFIWDFALAGIDSLSQTAKFF